MAGMGIEYRLATLEDVDGIAALHADSWRRNYRGAYSDSYLDGDVFADRRTVWGERLSAAGANTITIVAEHDASVVGFAHTVLDEDPEYGALVDNLHVTQALKGSGIGTHLLSEAACAVLATRPQSGLFLWVLEQNEAAQAFYDARGGARGDRRLGGPFPGGGRAHTLRYVWLDPSVLVTD
jgi:ribosomal protein S18 acetylase RimI-like enzyme